MSNVLEGTVKWFAPSRGYGFVCENGDDTKEYFTHYSVINVDWYKSLDAGQKVTFFLKETEKGTQATDVTPIK